MVVMNSIAENILTSTPMTVHMTTHMIMPMTITVASMMMTMTTAWNATTIKQHT